VSLTKPKGGMFRRFRGIKTILDTSDPDRYRKVLPDIFEMPDPPLILAFAADYIKVVPWPMTRYQEGAWFLKCIYMGKEYWYCLTMPVTKRIPMWGGRRIGYPKYIADKITLKHDGENWEGNVTHRGACRLGLKFTAGIDRELEAFERPFVDTESFFYGSSLNLVPPKKGPSVFTVTLDHKVEPIWKPVFGMVRIKVDGTEEVSGLFDPEKTYIGMFNEFSGAINLIEHRIGEIT
jgi:hypothetical protein